MKEGSKMAIRRCKTCNEYEFVGEEHKCDNPVFEVLHENYNGTKWDKVSNNVMILMDTFEKIDAAEKVIKDRKEYIKQLVAENVEITKLSWREFSEKWEKFKKKEVNK